MAIQPNPPMQPMTLDTMPAFNPADRTRKFLNSGDVPRLLRDETLKISRTKYYREQYPRMEVPDRFINDPDDGRVRFLQGGIMSPVFNQHEAGHMASMGINPELARHEAALIFGNEVIYEVDHFILSMTNLGDDDGRAVFCTQRTATTHNPAYDACVEINTKVLVGLLQAAVIVGNGNAPIIPFVKVFAGSHMGDVEYIESQSWKSVPKYLVKHPDFASQQEVRIFFSERRGHGVELQDSLIIQVPGLRGAVKQIF